MLDILASIYRIFKEISPSSNISVRNIIVPTQYVYEWISDYFDTFYCSRHHQNDASICIIIKEMMPKYIDLAGARRLFLDVDICCLH